MSDFDFDELDKAVNSALGQRPDDTTSDSNTQPVSSIEGITPTDGAADSAPVRQPTTAINLHNRTMASARVSRHETPPPEMEAPTEEAAPAERSANVPEDASVPDTNSRTRNFLPARRSGRFMDVVHPSSDMRSRANAAPTSRVGTTVASVSQPSETLAPEPDTPVVDSFTSASADTATVVTPSLPANKSLESAINDLLVSEGHAPVPVASSETSAPQAEVDETPEPASVETPTPTTPAPETSAPQLSSEATPTEDLLEDFDGLKFEEILNDKASETSAPQTSPFIEGAKVDKRPLGGLDLGPMTLSETPSPVTGEQEVPETSKPADSDEELERPTDVSAEEVLPEELNDTVVAIEAASAEDGAAPASLEIETETPETLAPSAESDEKNSSSAITRGAYEGPTSIAKQYKEEPRHDDDDSGDIFDTKTYHQPIKNDEKGHSIIPWVIALVILILLVVGGVFFAWWSGILPSL